MRSPNFHCLISFFEFVHICAKLCLILNCWLMFLSRWCTEFCCKDVWHYSKFEGGWTPGCNTILRMWIKWGVTASEAPHHTPFLRPRFLMMIKMQYFSQFCTCMTKYWCLLPLALLHHLSYRLRNNIWVVKGAAKVRDLVEWKRSSCWSRAGSFVVEREHLLFTGAFYNLGHHYWCGGSVGILVELLVKCRIMLRSRSPSDAVPSYYLISVAIPLSSPAKKKYYHYHNSQNDYQTC